jgi:hypothetical protein
VRLFLQHFLAVLDDNALVTAAHALAGEVEYRAVGRGGIIRDTDNAGGDVESVLEIKISGIVVADVGSRTTG